jgi:hypothetical protein
MFHLDDGGLLLSGLSGIWQFHSCINEKLNIWREAWAQHGMRTVHSSPQALGFWTNSKSNWYISIRFRKRTVPKGFLMMKMMIMKAFSFDISEECRNDLSANVIFISR